jgi:hypothetical protein
MHTEVTEEFIVIKKLARSPQLKKAHLSTTCVAERMGFRGIREGQLVVLRLMSYAILFFNKMEFIDPADTPDSSIGIGRDVLKL